MFQRIQTQKDFLKQTEYLITLLPLKTVKSVKWGLLKGNITDYV